MAVQKHQKNPLDGRRKLVWVEEEDRLPWERLPNESPSQWMAFKAYRDLDTSKERRSVRRAYRVTHPDAKSYPGRWGEWCSTHQWIDRARAFDLEMERAEIAGAVLGRREMTKRHTQIAVGFQGKVIERLQSIKPEQMTPKQAAEIFDIAVRLERLSRGVPETTSTVTQKNVDGGVEPGQSNEEKLLESMTDDELETLYRIKKNAKERMESGDD